MLALAQSPTRQVLIGFAAGTLLMALLTLAGPALAQTATPPPAIGLQQMLEWCRQMMVQAGPMMQGMMGGMCMMGR